MKHLILLGTMAGAMLLVSAPSAHAVMTAANSASSTVSVIQNFRAGLASLDTARFEAASQFRSYEPGASEPEIAAIVISKGVGAGEGPANALVSSKAALRSVDHGTERQVDADLIRTTSTVYARFTNTFLTSLDNSWISMPASEAKGFARQLGMTSLFNLGMATDPDPAGSDEEFYRLAALHNAFVQYQKPTVRSGKYVTYYLEYNRATVVAFLRAFQATLSEDERANSLFAIEGFDAGLGNAAFVDALVEHSAQTMTFEKKTGRPLEFASKDVIPAFGGRDETIVYDWYYRVEPAKKLRVKLPTSSLTAPQALKMIIKK